MVQRVAILNAYDVRNLGDQAIVHCQLAWCKHYFQHEVEVFVYSHHFKKNAEILGSCSKEPPIFIPPEGGRVERLVKPLLDWFELTALGGRGRKKLHEFLALDGYLLCGGGYLYSSAAPVVSRNLGVACLQGIIGARTGKPSLLFPQTLGPFSKVADRWIVRRLSRCFGMMLARDERSLAVLNDWGYGDKSRLVPDIVLAMRRLCPEFYNRSTLRSGLGIAPVDCSFAMPFDAVQKRDYLFKLKQLALKYHQKTGEAVRVFIQVGLEGEDDDATLAVPLVEQLLKEGVPTELVRPDNSLGAYLGRMQENRIFIGSRMHACIFSLTTGTPTIGLGYQPKFEGLFELMNLSDWLSPIDDWTVDWAWDHVVHTLDSESDIQALIVRSLNKLEEQVFDGLQDSFDSVFKV